MAYPCLVCIMFPFAGLPQKIFSGHHHSGEGGREEGEREGEYEREREGQRAGENIIPVHNLQYKAVPDHKCNETRQSRATMLEDNSFFQEKK